MDIKGIGASTPSSNWLRFCMLCRNYDFQNIEPWCIP